MRFLLSVLLIVFSIATMASAELLVTANPIGQGKWGVLGAGIYNANAYGFSALTTTAVGAYVGYGATDKLDVYANLGQMNLSGGGISTINSIGLNAKYLVAAEGRDLPVSVSVGAGYKSLSAVQTSTSGSQIMVGIGASKVMVPFIPYGGLAYRSTSSGGTAVSTQIDLTVGSALAWSAQGAVFVEDTLQSITPNGGSAYSSNQIALGVGYAL